MENSDSREKIRVRQLVMLSGGADYSPADGGKRKATQEANGGMAPGKKQVLMDILEIVDRMREQWKRFNGARSCFACGV